MLVTHMIDYAHIFRYFDWCFLDFIWFSLFDLKNNERKAAKNNNKKKWMIISTYFHFPHIDIHVTKKKFFQKIRGWWKKSYYGGKIELKSVIVNVIKKKFSFSVCRKQWEFMADDAKIK